MLRGIKLSILDQVRITSGDASRTLENSIQLARLGDELGYRRYWVAEHHASDELACSSPEVLLARIGAETSTIRIGAGGILLPHYSPLKVAEIFWTLEALYPGRVDLGIGRAPGCGSQETRALQRYRIDRPFAEDFEEQLTELLGFVCTAFPAGHPFCEIKVTPRGTHALPVWLLGSGPSSAALAANFGLPYAFAQFIAPRLAVDSFKTYRHTLDALDRAANSKTILAIGAVCVEAESQVQALAVAERDRRGRTATPPQQHADPVTVSKSNGRFLQFWERSCFVGLPEIISRQIATAAEMSGTDEVMILAPFGDHDTCIRSYELLAKAFALKPVHCDVR